MLSRVDTTWTWISMLCNLLLLLFFQRLFFDCALYRSATKSKASKAQKRKSVAPLNFGGSSLSNEDLDTMDQSMLPVTHVDILPSSFSSSSQTEAMDSSEKQQRKQPQPDEIQSVPSSQNSDADDPIDDIPSSLPSSLPETSQQLPSLTSTNDCDEDDGSYGGAREENEDKGNSEEEQQHHKAKKAHRSEAIPESPDQSASSTSKPSVSVASIVKAFEATPAPTASALDSPRTLRSRRASASLSSAGKMLRTPTDMAAAAAAASRVASTVKEYERRALAMAESPSSRRRSKRKSEAPVSWESLPKIKIFLKNLNSMRTIEKSISLFLNVSLCVAG